MGIIRLAVGVAVVALLAGHGLSTMEPARRDALWISARRLAGNPSADALARSAALPWRPAAPPSAQVVMADAPATGSGAEVIAPDRLGQFQAAVEIGGQRLSALVDTGASFVALSYEDADRLGIRPMPADFRYPTSTANGRAMVAKVDLPSVRLGGIVVRDVTAVVGERGALRQSLLGMSFLSRLSSVRMDHGRMLLEP